MEPQKLHDRDQEVSKRVIQDQEQAQDDVDDDEEEEDDDEDGDTDGMSRSYECVFCKRGFTTAQALGGHMNIHRKDRARNSPSTSRTRPVPCLGAAAKHRNQYNSSSKLYRPMFLSCPQPPSPSSTHKNYLTYSPTSMSVEVIYHADNFPNQMLEAMRLKTGGASHVDDASCDQGEKGEDELDLELRLGHDL